MLDIPQTKLKVVRQVRAGGGVIVVQYAARTTWSGLRSEPFVQQGGAWLHGLRSREHGRQFFVLYLDERQGFLSNVGAGGRHCRDGVPFIEHLVRRQNVVAHKAHVVDHPFGEVDEPTGRLRQVSRGDHRIDAREFHRMPGVDRFDAGMHMRAAQDLAIQHSR